MEERKDPADHGVRNFFIGAGVFAGFIGVLVACDRLSNVDWENVKEVGTNICGWGVAIGMIVVFSPLGVKIFRRAYPGSKVQIAVHAIEDEYLLGGHHRRIYEERAARRRGRGQRGGD
nr:MAG: hypothetical protein A2V48_02355 [Candidatus Amesbacteria bacterium RBG_19FT_COMBO_48_16]